MGGLQPFKDLVAQRCGLTLDETAEANLQAALDQRMEAAGIKGLAAYYTRLMTSEAEFHELVALLTVNETYFFREPAHLTFLTETLLPRVMGERTGSQPVRILSAGCSTGEEPYSIAIALREKFGDGANRLASVTGVDIDHRALTAARRGEYGEFSFRALPADIRARHFASSPPHLHVLNQEVRSLVRFHQINLLNPAYPPALRGFDIVFFRNVSIYFDAKTRKAILANLHAAMTEAGILLVGASETMANDLGVFHLVQEGEGFYFSKTTVSSSLPSPLPRRAEPRSPASKPKSKPSSVNPPVPPASVDWPSAVETIRRLLREKAYQQALHLIQSLPSGSAAELRPWLLDGHIRLQIRQFSQVEAIASQVIDHDPWSADALVLLALSAKWRDDPQTAIRHLKAIVYSKPDCWPAHYYLGTLFQDSEPAKADRAYGTALRQITANPDPDGGLWLPLDLPVADIRFLCERRCAADRKK